MSSPSLRFPDPSCFLSCPLWSFVPTIKANFCCPNILGHMTFYWSMVELSGLYSSIRLVFPLWAAKNCLSKGCPLLYSMLGLSFVFSIIGSLTRVKCNPKSILICISMLAQGIEHFSNINWPFICGLLIGVYLVHHDIYRLDDLGFWCLIFIVLHIL